MSRLGEFFDFSAAQLRFVLALCAVAAFLTVYLLVRSYTTPALRAPLLPVIVGEPDRELVGAFLLDPNTAPPDSLELLPGIGKVLADRIVQYRESRRFQREVDITEVQGIGPKQYERLRPYLRINHP